MPDDLFQTADAWQQRLTVGDIVLFRSPLFDPSDGTEARPRPCLVSDIAIHFGATFVELLPGLPGAPLEPGAADIVADEAALIPAVQGDDGLIHFPARKAARFEVGHAGFVRDPDGGSPVIGRLYGAALAQLEALRTERQDSRERHLAEKRRRRQRR